MITSTLKKKYVPVPELIEKMLAAGATESEELTAVLNERYNEIVLVPTDHLPNVELNPFNNTDLLIINPLDYSDLVDEFLLEDKGEDITRAYFINRLRKVTGYGTAWIARKGWSEIFDYLTRGGMTIQAMLTDIPRIANSFQEQTPADILNDRSIDHKAMTADEKLEAATAIINANENTIYIASYDVEGETRILYSE